MLTGILKFTAPAAFVLAHSALAAAPGASTRDPEFHAYTARAWQEPSPDVETSHWAELSQKAVRQPPKLNGVYGKSKLYKAEFGGGVSIPVEVGGQTFQLILDTGSSDTWVAKEDFVCVGNTFSNSSHPTQATCAFGPLYKNAPGFERIPDRNFNLTYADLEYINGIPGHDTVTVAGIAVPDAHINLVNKASWDGDNFTSGLIGLAYPALTSLYAGDDPAKDQYGGQIQYAPFFKSMYTNASVPPVFSLALDRQPNSYGLVGGGKIAFGGLPPVNYTGDFAKTQIIIHEVVSFYPAGETHYSEYTIIPDGFVFPGGGKASMVAPNSNSIIPAPSEDSARTNVPMIIDSGTTLMYIPLKIAKAVNAAFSPPAKYDPEFGVYITKCSAVPPKFGVVIGGKIFYLNPQDMFAGRVGHGDCATGISFSGSPPKSKLPPTNVLGDTLLKNVLAVFDVGAGEMRFASREQY